MSYFDDVGVKTLSYLDSLFQWDNLQKSKFYKGLPQIIIKLPHRINMFRILPCLSKEFVNHSMVPFVLPNVLLISENCNPKDFTKHILPCLKPIMKIQEPIQVLLIFMQKMELLLKLTPSEDVKTDVLPILYRALESDNQQIQELCLSVLPTFAALVDYPAMKNACLPRIKKLCLKTPHVSVKVNCLLCIGKLMEHLDKWLVLDEILPFLPQIPSREPAVLMGILGIYKLALTHNKLGITKELMANKIIPFLVPLCIENGLTLNQFNALMTLVKDMINRVESEHKTKLEQLNSIKQEKIQLEDLNFKPVSSPIGTTMINNTNQDYDGMFSFFELNNSQEKSNAFDKTNTSNFNDKKTAAVPDIVKPFPKIIPPPQDLTSILHENNLKDISVTQKQMSNAETDNWISSNTTNSNILNNIISPTAYNANNNLSFNNTQTEQRNWSSPPFANNSLSNNWYDSKQWTHTGTPMNVVPSTKTQDLSVFDSLLPHSKPAKLSLNQMQSGKSPAESHLLPQSNNSAQQANMNVLSTEDIMNFLNN